MSEYVTDLHYDVASSICVIRGNSSKKDDGLHSFLQRLGLQIVTKDTGAIWTGDGSPFDNSIMDQIFERVRAVIILISGDERVRLSSKLWKDKQGLHENKFLPQPALDLIFKSGYAFACHPKHTILLQMGKVNSLSDIDGRFIANFSEAVEDRLRLIRLLISVGCKLSIADNELPNLGLSSEIDAEGIVALIGNVRNAASGSPGIMKNTVDKARGKTYRVDAKKVFVIYGRNKAAKDAVFGFLRTLDLSPIEWGEAISTTHSGAPYIGQILEALLKQAQATLVLLTGDDELKQRGNLLKKGLQPVFQPRPNVVFETGMAFGNAELKDKTMLLEFGSVKIWPTLEGRHRFSYHKDTKHYWAVIDNLRHLGCEINIEDEDLTRRMWINISRYC